MPRFSANLSVLFKEVPLLERFAAAKAAGFDAVEIQFPYEVSPDALAAAKHGARVEFDLLNLPAGDFSTGLRGIAALPGREAEFRGGIERVRPYVEALGARKANVLA